MKWWALLVLVACVALYAPSLDHFFVSDDFLNLERNSFQTLAEALAFFSTKDIDFYRPIPRLHFGLFDGFFGDRVVFWNLGTCLLHGLASVAAGLLAASLLGTRNTRAARYAALFFAVHFIHAEPVVWASGVTSVYATLFLFLALYLFRRARETDVPRYRHLSVLAFAGALLSKETAVAFVPLLLLTTAFWPIGPAARTRRWPTFAEALPYLILLAAYAVVVSGIERGGDASPYRLTLGIHVLKNTAFFFAGGFLPLRYWEIQDVWTASLGEGGAVRFVGELARNPLTGLPLVLGAAGLGLAAIRGPRDVRGGLLWILAAATPFLLLPGSGERFLYLASFGACLVFGLAAQALPRLRVLGRPLAGRAVVIALLAMHVAANIDRQADWVVAARWTREIRNRWTYLRTFDPEGPIEFVGIPDAYRSAWVFRNGFDSMARLYWEGRPYRREGGPPVPGPAPERIGVVLYPSGTLGMMPAHLLPEGTQGLERPDSRAEP